MLLRCSVVPARSVARWTRPLRVVGSSSSSSPSVYSPFSSPFSSASNRACNRPHKPGFAPSREFSFLTRPPRGEGDKYVSPFDYTAFYSHYDRHVDPLYGKEGNPWVGLVLLTGINVAIFVWWNIENGQPDDIYDAHQDFMQRHFTGTLTNLREGRVWTLITPAFSHQEPAHLGSNMFAMWLFGFNTYRVLNVAPLTGGPGFFLLYLLGGLGASVAELGFQVLGGHTGKALTSKEQRALANADPQLVQQRLQHADIPGLGASGSIMAITAVAACLFPWDRVLAFGARISLPMAAALFIFSDAVGLTQSAIGGVGHAAHLGGALVGFVYIRRVWPGPLPISRWMRGEIPRHYW